MIFLPPFPYSIFHIPYLRRAGWLVLALFWLGFILLFRFIVLLFLFTDGVVVLVVVVSFYLFFFTYQYPGN